MPNSITMARRGLLLSSLLALCACQQAPLPPAMPHGTGKAAPPVLLQVLTAGAIKPVLLEIAADFEATHNVRLVLQNDTAGGLVRRVQAGEAHDVLINTVQGFETLAKAGKPAVQAPRAMAKVGIGIAVRAGAPVPRITNAEEFKRALLAAGKVAFTDPASGGTSGIYLSNWFERHGIGPHMRAKAVMSQGGLTAEFLVKGQADIAVQQMSELMAVPGVTIVGHLPEDIQRYTTYAIAPSVQGASKAAVADLISYLGTAKAHAVIKAKGMQALL